MKWIDDLPQPQRGVVVFTLAVAGTLGFTYGLATVARIVLDQQ